MLFCSDPRQLPASWVAVPGSERQECTQSEPEFAVSSCRISLLFCFRRWGLYSGSPRTLPLSTSTHIEDNHWRFRLGASFLN